MYDLNDIKLEFLEHTATRIENVSDADYFGDAYRDYISNSLLKLINPDEGGAPTRFLQGFDSKPSTALELGSAVHQMILEKDTHFLSPVDKPSGKIGLIIDTYHQYLRAETSKTDNELLIMACEDHDYYKGKLTDKKLEGVLEKGKEYLEFLQTVEKTEGCIILTELQKEKLDGCLTSVANNKLITDLLFPKGIQSYNEDVMTMSFKATLPADIFDPESVDEEIELKLKAKIDNWSIDFDNKVLTLNDLKTTGNSIHQFAGLNYDLTNSKGEPYKAFQKGSFQKYHYYRQMAMYGFILKSYAMNAFQIDDTWEIKINMLVVETNKPYLSHVFSVGESWINNGLFEFYNLLKRVAFHKIKGFDKFVEMDLCCITEI